MDLKLMQRFVPYALIAVIAISSSLWSRRSGSSKGNPERSINSEEGEAETSPPPSSPPPPPLVREDIGFRYDVFLSFRGPDTRNGFTGHLYAALKVRGILAFIDSEDLEKGEKVEELFKCIERSKVSVPIFSKRYVESKWCLKEIAKIVECKNLILPVFFDVEPKDVRHQTGPFADAFRSHLQDDNIDKEDVSKWSAALAEAGKVSGYHLASTGGNQSMLIEDIVRKIVRVVNNTPLFVAEHPVGLKSRSADLMKMMEIETHTEAKMVGIHGLGGVGKTTVAMTIYNQISSHFDACCFLLNVRSVAANPSKGLIFLQEQLLQKVFKDKNTDISNIYEGINKIRQGIESKKVLLVLDDVDDGSQLEALANSVDWFASGSKIIITTRDEKMLRAAGVRQHNMYKLKGLDFSQSLELFSWHAFRKEEPDLKFGALSVDVASVAAGLPLALKIFGSLFGVLKTVELWVSKLAKLRKAQNKGLHETLKISYDALEENTQKVFLDIACFFIGEGREDATYMWEGCEFFPDLKIEDLIDKCLVSTNYDMGEFEMHDLIRDMGRKIAQDSRSRLWKDDETLDVLETKKGTEKIEAIQLNSGTYWPPMYVEAESFVAMSQLRMLRLGAVVHLKGEFEHFPKKLRWLEWHPQDLDSLPGSLHLENIVVLDLSHSRITQLWNPQGLESTKVFGKMKVLNLAGCYLTSCPDFNRMTNLQKLNFAECREMSELDPSIGHLKSLTHLSLNGCWSLKTLPQEIWQLTSLEELDVSYCTNIITLPSHPLLKLGKLKVLNLTSCWNLTSCPDFERMPHLEKLDFAECREVSELDPSIGLLERLTHLSLRDCVSLKTLPQKIWQLTSLEELDLTHCLEITTLPTQMEDPKSLKLVLLGKLKVLKFFGCWNLTIRPDFTSMPYLEKLDFTYCKKMSELDPSIGLLESLTHLELRECRSLKTLPQEIWQLTSLEELDLSFCTEITTLPSQLEDPKSLKPVLLGKLKVLNFNYCSNLTISPQFTSMPHLQKLNFLGCSKMSELDPSIGLLESLTHFSLSFCRSLKTLPQEIWQLTSLYKLDLSYCTEITALPSQLEDPQSLKQVLLGKLKVLSFSYCSNLTICPDFTSMPHLEVLDFRNCTKMSELDPSIGLLKRLTHLYLEGCESLKELPQEVSQLTSLITLNLNGCYQISALPKSMSCLKQLERLRPCSSLTEIPDCICSFVLLDNLKQLSVSHCCRLKLLPWFLPSLNTLEARCCGKLEDVPGINQMILLWRLDLGGCRSLHDSFFKRLQEANFQNLEEFCIPGRRLLSYPQSLSFLLPKLFEIGILYLHVDKSSLDNICSELDKNGGSEGEDESIRSGEYRNMDSEDESLESEEDRNMDSNDSELAYKSIPSDEVKDSRPGRVVSIEITTGDARFQFSALIKFEGQRSKLPKATFARDSELMKMVKQGEFKGNGDARLRTMMTMRVSIDGCVLLHGDLFTYMKFPDDRLMPDPIKADDNFVIVKFGWPI